MKLGQMQIVRWNLAAKLLFFHIYFPLNKMVLNKSSELLNLAFAYEDEAKIQSRWKMHPKM